MKSISFPSMFGATSTKTVLDRDATFQNLILLLGSEEGEFKSDPYYGIRLKRLLFEQNNFILRDIVIDGIYSKIKVFMPQLLVNRRDITLVIERAKISCNIKTVNRLDFTTDMYNIVLFSNEGE